MTNDHDQAGIRFKATKMLHTARGPQRFDLAFEARQGEILAISGPSGAGKTTLLLILAGLTATASGHITVGDETWLDSERHIHLPTRHRSIGFVFQDFALFPHMTVRKQLEFAMPANADTHIINELLELMDLEALQHLRPALLSGGQQQRVAIARAIARKPRLLLLDEPLSALDDEMRGRLQDYILKARQRYHMTILLVSHHLPEIFRLADSVITLDHGRIVARGLPSHVFPHEKNSQAVHLTATIIRIIPAADSFLLTLACADTTIDLTISAAEAASLQTGQQVTFSATLLAPQILPSK
jgi:molybdate transport system ATP-binding protein